MLPVRTIARAVETFLVKGTDEDIAGAQKTLVANYPAPHYHITRYNITTDETIFSIWRPYDLI